MAITVKTVTATVNDAHVTFAAYENDQSVHVTINGVSVNFPLATSYAKTTKMSFTDTINAIKEAAEAL